MKRVSKRWVSIGSLPNPAFRETVQDAIDWLDRHDYWQAGRATLKAIRSGLARSRDGRDQWNLTRYVSLRRNERRSARSVG